MTRPGTVVTLRDLPSSVSVPTDTGTAFVVGTTDMGPLEAVLVGSLTEFVSVFGDRQSYSSLYDAMELFFKEGGYQAYVSRVVGPAASVGTLNLLDGVAAVSLIANAVGPGAWSANYKVGVVAGVGAGTYQIEVTDAANNVLENSGDLADQLSAVQWSQTSNYIRLALGAAVDNPAVVAPAALSAGADDRLNITDAEWLDALNLFGKDLGPGQVFAPGRTTTTGHTQLIDHAEANNRVALLDLADTATLGTLEAAATAATSRMAACFTPWVEVPATTGTTTRTVPPSALVAGLIAKNDGSLGTNRPSAGMAGVSSYATDVSQPAFTDANREELNSYGVNVIRVIQGTVRVYGWRSLADPATDSSWLSFGNSRLFMKISAELDAIAENFLFDEIDGQDGQTIGAFHDALAGVLLSHYTTGELFGNSADEAFSVDTGHSVNTLATIANLELHAVCDVKMSPFAEYVQIEVVKRQITDTV